MNPELWSEPLKMLGILLGGGAVGAIVVKWMNRSVDVATVNKIHAEAREIGAQAAQAEVQFLRDIISEIRASDQLKTNLISTYSAELTNLKERVAHLEERERHALSRASVHEAWDQMAFQMLVMQNPQHPPPPPLLPPGKGDPYDG